MSQPCIVCRTSLGNSFTFPGLCSFCANDTHLAYDPDYITSVAEQDVSEDKDCTTARIAALASSCEKEVRFQEEIVKFQVKLEEMERRLHMQDGRLQALEQMLLAKDRELRTKEVELLVKDQQMEMLAQRLSPVPMDSFLC
jgi:hypothetical protein